MAMMAQVIPTHLSFLDRQSTELLDHTAGLGLRQDEQTLLLFTVTHRSSGYREWFTRITRICTDAGALDARICDDSIKAAVLPLTLRTATTSGAAPG